MTRIRGGVGAVCLLIATSAAAQSTPSEAREPAPAPRPNAIGSILAVTILGGQVLCLLLTLLVTPVVYSYFDDLREIEWRVLLHRLIGRRSIPESAVADSR